MRTPWKWLALLLAVAAIVSRQPGFIVSPRLWAEEGKIYLAYSYSVSGGANFWFGIFNVGRGAINIWPGIATTIAANFFPLSYAPWVTTIMALIVQVATIAFVLFAKIPILESPIKKTLSILAVLFTPLSGEIWLTTIGSQFFFLLLAFFVILANPNKSFRPIVIISGLSGMPSCLLAPVFLFQAITDKNRERFIQAGIMATVLLIQIFIAITVRWNFDKRGFDTDWRDFFSIAWTQGVGLMVFGLGAMREMSKIIIWVSGYAGWYSIVSIVFFFVESLSLYLITRGMSARLKILFIAAYVILVFASIFLSAGHNTRGLIEPGNSQRYFYAPNVILVIALISRINQNKFSIRLLVAGTIIIFGAMEWQELNYSPDFPKWPEQISIWEKNNSYMPEIWPPGWRVRLSKIERR